ncbi:hypothetical protein BVRB_4g086460 [Beta vulgaris subsp. vulgaris]|nr:hypothetical protein BVRB_4g086460 [Beta vulgaris subsp. vulgaris]
MSIEPMMNGWHVKRRFVGQLVCLYLFRKPQPMQLRNLPYLDVEVRAKKRVVATTAPEEDKVNQEKAKRKEDA